MATRYANVDRRTPLLLPPDVREWIAEDDLAHFILNAVEMTDLSLARVNARGTGDAQYPPAMMLALLIYSYAVGRFSSRAIERSTHDSLAARYLCANLHPDHDTIARFRRENGPLMKTVFVRVLALAKELKILRLGMVSVDGTKIAARAGKTGNRTREQLAAEMARLEIEVEGLLAQAESADTRPPDDGLSLPKELASRTHRLEQLRQAQERLDQRCREKNEPPGADDTVHPVEPDSGLMPTAQGPFTQGYNVQAPVSAEGTTLILGGAVVTDTNDRRQLVPTINTIPEEIGVPPVGVADSGYDNCAQIEELEARGMKIYCPPQKVGAQEPRGLERKRIWQQGKRRREELNRPEARKIYGNRARSSEPVFHIVKHLMGFKRFMLRGLEKVNLEWNLVAIAYNCRKINAVLA